MFDYETMRLIWWAFIGIILIVFAVMDGFDFGVLALLPFLGKNDEERGIIVDTVSPVWEGNQIWLILGAGAIFAAWPYLYAVAFSGFYFAMFLALSALILRPVSFKFRSKMPGKSWHSFWEWCLFIGGVVPPVIFGVAVGNALEGVPFTFDNSLRITYLGSFLDLLNPFALLAGLISIMMMLTHGAIWLAIKTEGDIHVRAKKAALVSSLVTIVLFGLAGIWVAIDIYGYRLTGYVDMNGPSNPLYKTVLREKGAWLANYGKFPISMIVPGLAVVGTLIVLISLKAKRHVYALMGNALTIMGIIATAGVSMFPFLLPSSLNPNASLTVWDASSSWTTLINMAIATVIFVPIVIVYTGWVYSVLRGKVRNPSANE